MVDFNRLTECELEDMGYKPEIPVERNDDCGDDDQPEMPEQRRHADSRSCDVLTRMRPPTSATNAGRRTTCQGRITRPRPIEVSDRVVEKDR